MKVSGRWKSQVTFGSDRNHNLYCIPLQINPDNEFAFVLDELLWMRQVRCDELVWRTIQNKIQT